MHGKLYSSFDRVTKRQNGLTTLERKPPRNPKFANVKGTLDTGNSFSKVKLISNREYIRRRSEIFKRVRPLTVYELIQENEEQHESINNLAGNEEQQPPLSPGSMVVIDAKADGDKYKRPYLILDCRTSPEDYAVCRISTSKHYPADWLRHDRITPTLYHYKNRENKVVIVYTLDDREGRVVARQFVEKGFDNVFLLTGGLEAFLKEFPQSVEGTLPEEAGMDDHLRGIANKSSSRPPLGNSTNKNKLTRGNIAKAGLETPGKSMGGNRNGRMSSARKSHRNAPSVAPTNFSTMSRTETLLNWKKK
jgi:centrosomal protein CEP41